MKKTLLISLAALASCDGGNYVTFTGFEQGTTYTIVAKDPAADTQAKIDAVFDEIDLTFSMFNPASLTGRINAGETDLTTPLFDELFAVAKSVHALTEGYYDPTVKPLVDAWGFGPGEQQERPCVECIMEYVGFDKIALTNVDPAEIDPENIDHAADAGGQSSRVIKSDPRVGLDFSSIAKGFTVDRLAAMLEADGATDYMVEVGGEVRARGVNAAGRGWRIGIDKPSSGLDQREMQAVAAPTDNLPSIATSGNYRNNFTDRSGRIRVHTIDPLTGMSAAGEILSVTVAALDCAVADAWATGIMASRTLDNATRLLENAAENGAAHGNAAAGNASSKNAAPIEYYIIYSADDGAVQTVHSPGFPLAE
ncbi:MAG: FAD:protein FMN transferase [Alistipes sp.]|jgi:thiamine biosynthesis lipoprotein|nr:FAD:protein FMN transferase [Alistipes sp.]